MTGAACSRGRGVACALRAAAMLCAAAVHIHAQAAPEPRAGRPDLEPWRVGSQLVVGTYAGYVGYFAGRWVGLRLSPSHGESPANATPIATALGYAGGVAATAGAVYGVGSLGDETGRFGTTVVGAAAGLGVAVVVNRVLLKPERNGNAGCCRPARRVAEFIDIFLPAIGATIAFNSTRAYAK